MMNFMRLFTIWNSSKDNTRSITKMMKMNWNVMVSSRNRKHMSQSMMIKAKNTIMKERTWINRVAQRDVTNVKRSGECSNMESRNLVPCVDLFKEFKTARGNVQEEHVISAREEPSLHVNSARERCPG